MRCSTLLLMAALCQSCSQDPACQALAQQRKDIASRLDIPILDAATPDQSIGPSRSLTKPVAKRLMHEVQLLRTQLPTSARDEELALLVKKLNGSRAALEQALEDFLAIDPTRLNDGLDSGATMPLRRGVVISRDALISLTTTACELCDGQK
jgi:hypothetical protein